METDQPRRESFDAFADASAGTSPAEESPPQVNDIVEEVPVNWRKKDVPSEGSDSQEPPTTDDATWEQRVREEQAKADDYLSRWQRTQADLSNVKRRNQQEREDYIKRANEEVIRDLLPVLDSFDRALADVPTHLRELPWLEGIILVDRQLRMALLRHGVTPIDAKGVTFDPTQHEAVTHKATTEFPDATVTEELQKGYRLHDRVLRPSLVEVASNPNAEVSGPAGQSTHEEK